jgi:hypothetical protein
MNLRASNQYTIEQVNAILHGIDISKRKNFNEEALLQAIDTAVNKPLSFREPVFDLPLFQPECRETVLIIATGPSVDQHNDAVQEFIRQHHPVVIECNPKNNIFEKVSKDYISAILNWTRLKKRLDNPSKSSCPIVTGIKSLPESYSDNMHLYTIPCHVMQNQVKIQPDVLTIPAYVVGMYAIGLGLLFSPKTIYITGFDGYTNELDPKQKEMNAFWENLKTDTKILSLTPTTYPVNMDSIFKFIR